jgi:hypothetical protein
LHFTFETALKQVYHLTLRAAQGFAQSLRELAFAELPVPNYTTLSRRAQDLKVALPVTPSGEPLHLVVDSTGVKLYGEGEWKVRKHGYSKRRTWRKVHLGPGREDRSGARGTDDASGCR